MDTKSQMKYIEMKVESFVDMGPNFGNNRMGKYCLDEEVM